MIKKFMQGTASDRVDTRGTISNGCKTIKAKCAKCNKEVYSLKLHDNCYCPDCNSVVHPAKGAPESTASLKYFVMPPDTLAVYPGKPTQITIVPAFHEIEKVIPNSYSNYFDSINKKSVKVPFCKGDGEDAERLNAKGESYKLKCQGDDCQFVKDKKCKPRATFYVLLPEVDMVTPYQVKMSSSISIGKIIKTLLRITSNGKIIMDKCILKLVNTTNSNKQPFSYLELIPPAIPLDRLIELGMAPSLNIDYQPQCLPPDQQDTASEIIDAKVCDTAGNGGNGSNGEQPHAAQDVITSGVDTKGANSTDDEHKATAESLDGSGDKTTADGTLAAAAIASSPESVKETVSPNGPADPEKKDDSKPTADRCADGRAKIREVLKKYANHPNLEKALASYISATYASRTFEELTVEELLAFYGAISNDSALVKDIRRRCLERVESGS